MHNEPVETMEIEDPKNAGEKAIINASDFDPEKHKLWGPAQGKDVRSPEEIEKDNAESIARAQSGMKDSQTLPWTEAPGQPNLDNTRESGTPFHRDHERGGEMGASNPEEAKQMREASAQARGVDKPEDPKPTPAKKQAEEKK